MDKHIHRRGAPSGERSPTQDVSLSGISSSRVIKRKLGGVGGVLCLVSKQPGLRSVAPDGVCRGFLSSSLPQSNCADKFLAQWVFEHV